MPCFFKYRLHIIEVGGGLHPNKKFTRFVLNRLTQPSRAYWSEVGVQTLASQEGLTLKASEIKGFAVVVSPDDAFLPRFHAHGSLRSEGHVVGHGVVHTVVR